MCIRDRQKTLSIDVKTVFNLVNTKTLYNNIDHKRVLARHKKHICATVLYASLMQQSWVCGEQLRCHMIKAVNSARGNKNI